jgi:L-seryl-tRNA(Ser) seleniumtransferase
MPENSLRGLPSVNDILDHPTVQALADQHSHDTLVTAIRCELADMRRSIQESDEPNAQPGERPKPNSQHAAGTTLHSLAERVAQRLQIENQTRLRPVINATGILLHTNLGRAPVAETAARAAFEAARGYLNLELDLNTGKRSSRQLAVREWVCRLSGAQSATAVNNNAAATVIALRALCAGKEVVISRGQLIEIGGSFRIPEIMAVSGAILREVGTTNITRLSDYERAIGPQTAALMQVHTSNYRISGFTKAVPLADLAKLAHSRGLPVIDDIGSGALIDFARFGFQSEPVARDSIALGADLVLFSGDKLLGGPQAGIIAGRMDLIQRIEKDPLMRAFRLDKMTLAALETTLRLYLNEERALSDVPILQMLTTAPAALRQRAEGIDVRLRDISGISSVRIADDRTYVGGGSLPDQPLKTWVLELECTGVGAHELSHRLRTGEPSVVGRIRNNKLILDLRTVFPEQETALIEALRRAAKS